MANPIDVLKELAAKFAGIEGSLAKITAAEDRVKALDADLAAAKQATDTVSAELDTEKKSHTDTKATLQAAQEEITTLKASVESEKARANEVIASQGLPLDQIPAGSTGQAKQEGTAFAQYRKLLETDPAAAGAYYAKNADAILSSRPK